MLSQLQYYSPNAFDGYTLFNVSGSAYLVDNCGEVVNKWSSVFPSYHAKLRPNGNLIYIEGFANAVVEKNWEDLEVKNVELNAQDIYLAYEVIVLPNGNYLCLGRKQLSTQDFIDLGFDYGVIGTPQTVDVVVEMDSDNGEIVWLWNIADHIIQERSDTISNFGSVRSNPQLLNLDAISTFDRTDGESFMINGFDYNPELDEIILSLRKMCEVVIIDHSTTIEEATGHSGGNSGKGGDILYRWGNPKNYNSGSDEAQYLFYQHNPNWILHGEHVGKIIMFNNGLNRPGAGYFESYSTTPIIHPPRDSNNNYIIDTTFRNLPDTPLIEYRGDNESHEFFSGYTSASKVLPNGNILITVGGESRVIELEPDGTLVWAYGLQNAFPFRAEKYSADFSAFENRDLTPTGAIENPPSQVKCNLVSPTINHPDQRFNAWVDVDSRILHIENSENLEYQFALFDVHGRIQKSTLCYGSHDMSINQNFSGLLILSIIVPPFEKDYSYKFFIP